MPNHNTRHAAIAESFKAGTTTVQLAEQYGVSRQRIQQILKRQGITRSFGGVSVRKRNRVAIRLAAKNRYYLEKYGMTWPLYRSLRVLGKTALKAGLKSSSRTPLGAFFSQRRNAAKREIEWNLSLGEWWNIWKESGKWNARGRHVGQYVMARKGDTGPYAIGNVEIITASQNHDDYLERRYS